MKINYAVGICMLSLVFESAFATQVNVAYVDNTGNKWAQVSDFSNLSWNDLNSACGAGVCSGQLNGRDVSGWKWATTTDAVSLFSTAIGFGVLNSSYPFESYIRARYPIGNSSLFLNLAQQLPTRSVGWDYFYVNGSASSYKYVGGWLANSGLEYYSGMYQVGGIAQIQDRIDTLYGKVVPISFSDAIVYDGTLGGGVDVSTRNNQIGAWLYQSANIAPIPEPETYVMLLVGLGIIGFMTRHMKNVIP